MDIDVEAEAMGYTEQLSRDILSDDSNRFAKVFFTESDGSQGSVLGVVRQSSSVVGDAECLQVAFVDEMPRVLEIPMTDVGAIEYRKHPEFSSRDN